MSLKVEIIGGGVRGLAHAEVLRATGRTITAIRDTDPERAVTSVSPSTERADVVVIATPNATHPDLIREALENNQHVVCEKPLALTATVARALAEEAAQRNLVLRAAYQLRYFPGVMALRDYVTGGKLGSIQEVWMSYGSARAEGFAASWRVEPQVAGGGSLVDQGTHLVDLATFILGRQLQIKEAQFWGQPIDMTARIMLSGSWYGVKFPVYIESSWERWLAHFSMAFHGTRGTAWLEGLGGKYGPHRLVLKTGDGTHASGPWSFSAREALQRLWEDVEAEILGLPHTGDAGIEAASIVETAYS